MEERLKFGANVSYIIGMIAAVMLLTHHTYGFYLPLKIIFFTAGAIGLILSLLQFRFQNEQKTNNEFNLLYWIGSVTIFLGFIFQLNASPLYIYVLFAGLAIVGISFFLNPFKKEKSNSEDLLDN